jgi:hypothetical protein
MFLFSGDQAMKKFFAMLLLVTAVAVTGCKKEPAATPPVEAPKPAEGGAPAPGPEATAPPAVDPAAAPAADPK